MPLTWTIDPHLRLVTAVANGEVTRAEFDTLLDELRAAFEQAGVDIARPIVTTCGSGLTAAIVMLALDEIGARDVAVGKIENFVIPGPAGDIRARSYAPVAAGVLPATALLAVPDPNVTLMARARVFPVEFVVRGYLTGSTDTSLWTHYARGEREYCGNVFPDGLVKNQR